MSVEAAVSLFAAWKASSPALLAIAGDSVVELFSAVGSGVEISCRCGTRGREKAPPKMWAEQCGFGFELPSAVPNVPKMSKQLKQRMWPKQLRE
jgi:hypothetical protein